MLDELYHEMKGIMSRHFTVESKKFKKIIFSEIRAHRKSKYL